MFVNFVCLVTLMLNFRRCCYGNQKFKKQINSFTKCDALGMGSSTNAIKRPIGIAAKLAKIAISAKIIHLGLQIGKTVLVTGDMHIFPVNWEMPKPGKNDGILGKAWVYFKGGWKWVDRKMGFAGDKSFVEKVVDTTKDVLGINENPTLAQVLEPIVKKEKDNTKNNPDNYDINSVREELEESIMGCIDGSSYPGYGKTALKLKWKGLVELIPDENLREGYDMKN